MNNDKFNMDIFVGGGFRGFAEYRRAIRQDRVEEE